MRKIAAAVILIISLFIAVPAITGQIEDANNAYERGEEQGYYRFQDDHLPDR
jgi:hypothetical protein